MPTYNKTTWNTTTTPLSVTNLQKIEDGIEVAYNNVVSFGVTTMATTNIYAVTVTPAPTAYVDGMGVVVKINANSTGAATLNVNGLGAKALKKANGNDALNLKTGGIYTFRYNATTGNFILQGEGGAGNAQPSDVVTGKTFTNDLGEQVGTLEVGKKFANGTVTSSAGQVECYVVMGQYNTVLTTTPYVEIVGLSFSPSRVILWQGNASTDSMIVVNYDSINAFYKNTAYNITITTANALNSSHAVTIYQGNDALNLKVTQSLVRLPVPSNGTVWNWMAIQ
jgi:hypothetical protein